MTASATGKAIQMPRTPRIADNSMTSAGDSSQVSAVRERVQITFSNSEALDFKGHGGDVLFYNYSTASKGAPALFVVSLRSAEWIKVRFGGREHRFSLEGSAKGLDAIHPCLQ
ncbi:hypothetical protein FBT96_15950 [Rhodobacter capsulatus]|uniref:Uncharacterized protein n=2 Tax=Rhodobacter capsulatus TaxID=1061 RepID=A0A4U1JMR1_RHOCA|nr:hypothetical protein FBT96_15950 [Rhodobacter capsulatus]